jgi:hypothetical protein
VALLSFAANFCDVEPASTMICPVNPGGGVAGFELVCGNAQCRYDHDGDVNGDGGVTVEDALCAFESYFTYPASADDCGGPGWQTRADVNCSGIITPGDALCIFRNWLDGSCVFCDATTAAPVSGVFVPNGQLVARTVSLADEVQVPVRLTGLDAVSSFGFDVTFPDGLTFAGVEPSAGLLAFDALKAREIENGVIRVGGYSHTMVPVDADRDVLTLRFAASPDARGTIRVDGFVDDLAGAAEVVVQLSPGGGTPGGRLALRQNHPNPFNPLTTIIYDVPAEYAGERMRIDVFAVDGSRVATLLDGQALAGTHDGRGEGRNDAGQAVSTGVYFYTLRVGEVRLQRKMVLLK